MSFVTKIYNLSKKALRLRSVGREEGTENKERGRRPKGHAGAGVPDTAQPLLIKLKHPQEIQ